MPFPFRGEPYLMDAAARQGTSGAYITLADGVTHYELIGAKNQPTVVFIHGFSVPSHIWDPSFTSLAEAGFRVLRYDLFGRGYSDRPEITYHSALFVRQLHDLLKALKITIPVHLVGLSMGGAIATAFTARHPQLVDRLCLMDPAGLPWPRPFPARLLEIPLIGELLLTLFGDQAIAGGLDRDFSHPEKYPDFKQKFMAQMPYKGFKQALVSTVRHDTLSGLTADYEAVGRQERPVLLIWGRQDETIPFAMHKKVLAYIPKAEFFPVDNAAHLPHYEQTELTNGKIIHFLQAAI